MRGSAHLRIAAVLALILPAWALAVMAPSIMLFGARLDEARAFAVDNAASRGWRILSVSSRSAVFEQILAGHDEGGSLIAERVLRIYADFAEDADGARVSLRAEEVEWPGGEDEWRTDVTGRYSDNLLRALASLRDKWDSRGPRPGPDGARPAPHGTLDARVEPACVDGGRRLGLYGGALCDDARLHPDRAADGARRLGTGLGAAPCLLPGRLPYARAMPLRGLYGPSLMRR